MLHLKKLHQYSCWHRLLFEKEFPTGCARSGWWTGDEVSGKIRNDNILQSYASPPTLPLSNLKHKSPDFEFLICCPLSVCLLDHVVEVPKIKNSNVSKDSISVLYFTLFSAQILGFQPVSVKVNYKFESLPVTIINYNTLIFWWIAHTTKYYFLITTIVKPD